MALSTIIFVPKGAEFAAIQRGLHQQSNAAITVIPMPMGPKATELFIKQWLLGNISNARNISLVIVMGLCGSLSPTLTVGDIVLYQSCIDAQPSTIVPEWNCDLPLLKSVQQHLKNSVTLVTAVTTDHMVHRVVDKQALAQKYGAQVVDMEGAVIFNALEDTGIPVITLRVVSDDLQHEIPDLSKAIAPNGDLKPLALALALLKNPYKGWNLVRGSMQGLKKLEAIASAITPENFNC